MMSDPYCLHLYLRDVRPIELDSGVAAAKLTYS